MKKFKVNEKCINCRACVRVADTNFKIEEQAVVYKQPENKEELDKCMSAYEICPTNAIEIIKNEVVISSSNIKEILDKYPILEEKLIELSPKFKMIDNLKMWDIIGKFATFKDAAQITGVSVCEILHVINKTLGTEDVLSKNFPNCIKEELEVEADYSVEQTWQNPENIINVDDDYINNIFKLIEKIDKLKENEALAFDSSSILSLIVKIVVDNGLSYNLSVINPNKVRMSIYKKKIGNWKDRKETFEKLDVRTMESDPFDIIIKKAYSTNEKDGFILVQTFVPEPMLNMLEEMGYEYEVEKRKIGEVWVYLYKKPTKKDGNKIEPSNKPAVVIQSATPVGYPIIMRLLQSQRLRDAISIKQLKVWEETEKHLGWIANKTADISFSALITASKLTNNDVIMPIIFVWDNFSLLTRGYKANSLEDLKGKTITIPLFEDAPPAKITKYLIQAKGLNVSDYKFEFGNPFGRPTQIMKDFILGRVDTVLLREPEASFAIRGLERKNIEYSELDYGKMWNEINKGFGLYPNAGVIIKGEFARKYPEIVKILAEELDESIKWVNENKRKAAKLSFDMMRRNVDDVEFFLNRVTFECKSGEELVKKVENFYKILVDGKILNINIDQKLLDMFK